MGRGCRSIVSAHTLPYRVTALYASGVMKAVYLSGDPAYTVTATHATSPPPPGSAVSRPSSSYTGVRSPQVRSSPPSRMPELASSSTSARSSRSRACTSIAAISSLVHPLVSSTLSFSGNVM